MCTRKPALAGMFAAAVIALPLALGGCPTFTDAVDKVCQPIASMPPPVVVALDAQDPHSALGVLWADYKAACIAGAPTPGVDVTWTRMIWGEIKVLLPQVLPALLPLLLGLL